MRQAPIANAVRQSPAEFADRLKDIGGLSELLKGRL
jgi:hypothetical protein